MYQPVDRKQVLAGLDKAAALADLEAMLLIRNFEIRAEVAYQSGKIGGFMHTYIGQEACQTSILRAFGPNHWWSTTYRCHALALLLGVTPESAMAELYGKATGNAGGRGGSMHLYTDRLMGGFGIVGGHTPIAAGAAFTLKYKKIKDEASICFLGDGATAQGAFHESLNLCALWNLPCLYVIENNKWGMGTAVSRAIASKHIAEDMAKAYNIQGYTVDGTDYLNCLGAFTEIKKELFSKQKPIIVECVMERFKGHSVSDPGLYRSKEELAKACARDPIHLLRDALIEKKWLTEDAFKELDKKYRERAVASMDYAEQSPWPNVNTLEEGVYAP